MNDGRQDIIIYNTADGKASVSLLAKDGIVWMNQNQLAELFDTSVPNISMHITNILKDNELDDISVVKNYLTTAADDKASKTECSRSCYSQSEVPLEYFLPQYRVRRTWRIP